MKPENHEKKRQRCDTSHTYKVPPNGHQFHLKLPVVLYITPFVARYTSSC